MTYPAKRELWVGGLCAGLFLYGRNDLSRQAGIVGQGPVAIAPAGTVAMTYPAKRELWDCGPVVAPQPGAGRNDLSRGAGIVGVPHDSHDPARWGRNDLSRGAGIVGNAIVPSK